MKAFRRYNKVIGGVSKVNRVTKDLPSKPRRVKMEGPRKDETRARGRAQL